MQQESKKKKIFDGRYEIISIVGRGASSVVYHARHAIPPTTDVALKVLTNKKGDDTSNSDRLRKEALAMVSSRHRYVIRLDDFHSVGDLCYLSMEFAAESDVRKYSARFGGRLDPRQGERFLLQSAEALGFIHRAGIIHRDIKPDNILVMNENEIRLGDFGVAVLPGEESTLDDLQRGVGTMDYMAPEVLEGIRYDQRSDVYALGLTFYEILSGTHPFARIPIMDQLEARKDNSFPHLLDLAPDVSEAIAATIMQAMSFDRNARFPSGREMLQAILLSKGTNEARVAAPKQPVAAPQPEPEKRPVTVSETSRLEETVAIDSEMVAQAQAMAARAQEQPDAKTSVNLKREDRKPPVFQNPVLEPKKAKSIPQKEAQESGQFLSVAKQFAADAKATFKPILQPILDRRSDPIVEKLIEKRHLLVAPIVGIVLIILWTLLSGGNSSKNSSTAGPGKATHVSSNSQFTIPLVSDTDFTFPKLPTGVYSGRMEGLFPDKVTPITLISLESSQSMIVLVGIPGWTPAVINLEKARYVSDENTPAAPLRVASNGMILDLTGQNVDGELMGYFTNVVTGDAGRWEAAPLLDAKARAAK